MTALGWAAADTWTLIRRELLHWVRQPAAVVANTLLFPIMIVLMFGYLLGGAMTVPGGGSYREFLVPGMFAMTMVFGIGSTLAAIGADTARGVTDRFRSMPTAAPAVLLARVGADLLSAGVTLVVLAGCGLLVGWQPHRDGLPTVAAFALLLLLRFAFCWIGAYLGVTFHGNPETITAARTLEFPIGFPRQPVRRHRLHAGLAGRNRLVEPALRHGHRHPAALRQPGRYGSLLGRAARGHHGDRLAVGDHGRVSPVVRPRVPKARPLRSRSWSTGSTCP